MELLPIIYTSLTIFAILAVTVIIASYISFKIKQKKKKSVETEKTKEKNRQKLRSKK